MSGLNSSMAAIRKKYYCAKCLIAEYPTDPKLKLKICTSCYLVKYCGKQCQVQDWRHHKKICKNRRKDLQILNCLEYEERYNLRMKLSDEALEFAEANADYFAFEQANGFRKTDKFEEIFVVSSKYPKWKEAGISLYLSAILEEREELRYRMRINTSGSAHLAQLLLTLIDARIPELDLDVEGYEVFDGIMKSSPPGNLFNKVYKETGIMDFVRKYLKDQKQNEFKAFKEETGIVAQVKDIIRQMNKMERYALFCIFINVHPDIDQGSHQLEQGAFLGLQLMKFFTRRPNMFQVLHEAWMKRKNPDEFHT